MNWLRRLGWTVASALVIVAALMLLAWLTLPWVVRSQGEQRLTALLGRQVTIGKVDVRPWSLEITLNDVAIAGATPQQPLFTASRLYANLQTSSIWHRGVVIKALQIDSPALRVTRIAEGRYDIDDLIARFTPKTPAEPAGEPMRFALANVELKNGSLHFDDRPAGRVHELKSLDLALPFMSDLPADVAVTVKPHLSFALNGAAFDSGAESTPFTADRASSLKLHIGRAGQDELDLAPYLGYLPTTLPVRIVRGRFGADIELQFAARPDGTPRLSLRGEAHISDLDVTDTAQAPLAGWKRLSVNLRDVQPLAHRVSLGAVVLDGATLQATRDAQGRINLATLASPPPTPKPVPQAASASAPIPSTTPPPPSPWQVSADSVAVTGTTVQWRDASTQPAAALAIEDLTLQATALQWPAAKPQPIKLSARLGVPGAPAAGFTTITIDGAASDSEASLTWKFDVPQFDALAPYLAGVLTPKIAGHLEADGRFEWAGGASPRMKVAVERAGLSDFRLTDSASVAPSTSAPIRVRGRGAPTRDSSRDDAIAFQSLRITQANIDLLAHRADIASIALRAPSARVERDTTGRWNVLQWSTDTAPAAATPKATPSANPAARPWSVRLADFALDDGRLHFTDEHPLPSTGASDAGHTVRLDVAGLKIGVKGIAWDPSSTATLKPVHMTLAATLGRLAEPQATAGPASLIDWRGDIALQPLAVHGSLRLQRIPAHAFAAYVDNPLRIELRRAYVSWRGDLGLKQSTAGLDVDASGEARVGDLSVISLDPVPASTAATPPPPAPGTTRDLRVGTPAPNELLRWQRLSLNAVKFRMRPGSAPRIDIGSAELADLYARLLITEQGRLNLQDVSAASAAASSPSAAQRAAPGASAVSAAPVVAAAAAPASAASSAMSINVEGTTLVNGRIDFADHFVQPNYSAALTELNGSLGAFHSGSTEMAALTLKGRAEGSALLDISGRLNPTASPLALDIHAKATDLELAPLSTYAGKYAGYAIERGKLSMDVAYKIDPDGRLEASNKVVINQLTFGDRIDSPQATRLPVRLAVALLKDRNGVINLDMPVSGSLKDPQFSVIGLIGRVLFNLLVKAVTSPFALLGGGGGGGESGASEIAFRPGTATLADGQQTALDKVAGALVDRPSLNLTVTGESDPARETDAYRSALLEQQLVGERRRELIRSGGAATPAPAASAPITLDAANRERLIKQIYDRSDIPGKPKNFIGLAKGIPSTEMEQRLKDAEPTSPEAMRELALQRGLAVRDALIAKGLKSDRLFLAAPKVGAAETAKTVAPKAVDGAASAVEAVAATPWVPRAELSLATN